MAMTKCTECDGAISTQAATCPHCGAPSAKPQPYLDQLFNTTLSGKPAGPTSGKRIGITLAIGLPLIFAVAAIVLPKAAPTDGSRDEPVDALHMRARSEFTAYLKGHNLGADDLVTQAGMPAEQLTEALIRLMQANPDWTGDALIASIVRKSPQHYYTYAQGGQFGYTSELTDADRERGIVNKPLVMFAPGAMSGPDVKTIVEFDGPAARVMSCRLPCAYATSVDSIMGQQTYPLVSGTVMWAAFQDAINDKM